jgi:hypothetical protein
LLCIARLDREQRREREREREASTIPLANTDKRERQIRETEFSGSESDKQEIQKEGLDIGSRKERENSPSCHSAIDSPSTQRMTHLEAFAPSLGLFVVS